MSKNILWKKLYEKEGVTVYNASVSGSKLVAFRGTVFIKASPDDLVSVFKDSENWGIWTDLLYIGKVYKTPIENQLVFYQAFKSPPFIDDRDAVYNVLFERDEKSGVQKVTAKSIDYSGAPDTVGIRMNIEFSRWTLTPRDGGTWLELETHADPGGWIPAWLTNFVQRTYCYDLLSKLRIHTIESGVKK